MIVRNLLDRWMVHRALPPAGHMATLYPSILPLFLVWAPGRQSLPLLLDLSTASPRRRIVGAMMPQRLTNLRTTARCLRGVTARSTTALLLASRIASFLYASIHCLSTPPFNLESSATWRPRFSPHHHQLLVPPRLPRLTLSTHRMARCSHPCPTKGPLSRCPLPDLRPLRPPRLDPPIPIPLPSLHQHRMQITWALCTLSPDV